MAESEGKSSLDSLLVSAVAKQPHQRPPRPLVKSSPVIWDPSLQSLQAFLAPLKSELRDQWGSLPELRATKEHSAVPWNNV